jgi:hypothetical protein
MENAVMERVAEVAKVLEKVAKHNVVALAILTQEEALNEAASLEGVTEGLASLDASASLSGTIRERVQSGSTKASRSGWQVGWDFAHHKFFPVMSLTKSGGQVGDVRKGRPLNT